MRYLFAKNTIEVFNLQRTWHFLSKLPTMLHGQVLHVDFYHVAKLLHDILMIVSLGVL
jgi:hypothetical protein